ncbi:MAG TPA: hypothetical protein ENI62_12195 [Gammaproteobacteria bacterium]|nr:hypothetical protein [Gammaproteobacteria bacterium]
MQKIVDMSGKPLKVSLSRAAERALDSHEGTLYAEMELYFSCLVRLKVYFRDHPVGDCFQVTNKLAVSFKSVMTSSCNIEEAGKKPPVVEFPVARPDAFSPRCLTIDYRAGEWVGEFSFLHRQAVS